MGIRCLAKEHNCRAKQIRTGDLMVESPGSLSTEPFFFKVNKGLSPKFEYLPMKFEYLPMKAPLFI